MFQKLVLVPIERWEKNRRQYSRKTSYSENSSSSSEEEYISCEESYYPVESVKVKNQKGLGKNVLPKTSPMFHFLNRGEEEPSTRLFHYLLKHKIFSLNSDGEIIRNGETLHDSNLIQLISHAVQNDSFKPIGMKYFYTMLKKKIFLKNMFQINME